MRQKLKCDKLKNIKQDKTQKLKMRQNSKTENVITTQNMTKLKHSKCGKIQKLKM